MGYSSRYHAASLAAVFAALAIGILIGAGFGQDVVSNTSDSLKKSLEGDLRDARAEIDDLNAERSYAGFRRYILIPGFLINGQETFELNPGTGRQQAVG